MSNIGRELYGDCDGYSDRYGSKRIEAEGYDWLVIRESFGEATLILLDPNYKQEKIEEWATKPSDREEA